MINIVPVSKWNYSDDEKLGAVIWQPAVNGQLLAKPKIPETTLSDWRRSSWWDALAERIRSEKADELDAKLSTIIDQALAHVLDRLENGDIKFDAKTLERYRVPVSARDATVIAAIMFDKRQILNHLPTAISSSTSSSRLEDLAERLRAIGSREVVGEVISENGRNVVEVTIGWDGSANIEKVGKLL